MGSTLVLNCFTAIPLTSAMFRTLNLNCSVSAAVKLEFGNGTLWEGTFWAGVGLPPANRALSLIRDEEPLCS